MHGNWLLIGLGAVLMAWGFWALWTYAPSRWVAVSATVLASEPVRIPSQSGLLFVPRVRYEYLVQGRRYESELYAYSSAEDSSGRPEVEVLLKSFTVGSTVEAWHRADRPGRACLKLHSRHSRSQMWAQVVGGLLVLGMGVFLNLLGSL